MGDERDDIMELDLNLEPPLVHPHLEFELGLGSLSRGSGDIEEQIEERLRRREAVSIRARRRLRRRHGRLPPETRNISMGLILPGGGRLQTGEGSVAAEERTIESCKTCKKNDPHLITKALGKGEDDVEKGNCDGSSFFDCNICLEMARDPVLTCCGHMFCWPCLYQWLHVHSDTKECPVCKGEVIDTNITPIYGRGNDTRETEEEEESGLKIPPRPHAQRVESLRQSIHRAASTFSIEDMIRQIGNRFDVTEEWASPQDTDSSRNMPEVTTSIARQILISRGVRRAGWGRRFPLMEQSIVIPPEDTVDLTQGITASSEAEGSHHIPSVLLQRSQSNRATYLSSLSSALSSAERLFEVYLRGHPMRRNHAQSPPIEDRDSVSSIAGVIHSESQTVDTAMEIDSTMSLSSSSSRRRSDSSRVSDVDSGVSHAPRRRRLN
ncbi:hypothetical protein HHK36_017656 [Tetracentron sinense]|uniref:E3 ubiquitin-protein ligase RMA n=1 Tax=Tetracentron sinense TaxID=13715 RepID=A0A834YUN7_TETSI|nr:hypothetical protein HHK36_017656 [Tetracentron sinense]